MIAIYLTDYFRNYSNPPLPKPSARQNSSLQKGSQMLGKASNNLPKLMQKPALTGGTKLPLLSSRRIRTSALQRLAK